MEFGNKNGCISSIKVSMLNKHMRQKEMIRYPCLFTIGLAVGYLGSSSPSLAANSVQRSSNAHSTLANITILGQRPGPTPFIAFLTVQTANGSLASIDAEVIPHASSFTKPLIATYSATFLAQRGWVAGSTVTVPIFALYAGEANPVRIVATFTDGSRAVGYTTVVSAPYTDPCPALNNITIQNSRRAAYDLSYDYVLIKDSCSSNDPTLIDTDGHIRWVGTANIGTQSVTFFNNAIYASDNGSGINRISLDGTVTKVGDYADQGVTFTGHHNIDAGRDGLVLDVNTTTQTESVNLEIDPATGAVLNRWDLADIIASAMRNGGDDPSQFVYPVGTDWFHNNATAYNPADNTLIVSSRENFVVAVDYDTPPDGVKKIHWILGDPTKKWFGFPSLRQFALRLAPGTLPPLGQHAVSIDHLGNLLLFDDGQASFFQSPQGQARTYSAARSYRIDSSRKTASAAFNYTPQPGIYSDICSSVYEGRPGNYLVDFSTAQGRTENIIQGIGTAERVIFDLRFPEINACGSGWNSVPILTHKIAY